MPSSRMEAFSDGVIAILITVMLLELKAPDTAHWSGLHHSLPTLLSYVLSFIYLGIYWNNHHHMLMATDQVDGLVLWANLHLLFWLSLIPFTTDWLGETHFKRTPAAAYGIVLLAAALAYYGLLQSILRTQGPDSKLAVAVGSDLKGRLSPVLYAIGIALSFIDRWLAMAMYIVVALMWFIPDRRVERTIAATKAQ